MRVRGLVVALAASAVLVSAGSSGAVGVASTFTDATGDQQGTAPDITTVGVANDARGQITFRITVANQTALAADSQVVLWLDTDRNPATGSPNTLGSDYVFLVADDGYSFARWNGSELDFDAPYASVSISYSSGATISVNRSELGNTTGFNFWVRGLQETGPDTSNIDDAPNDGTYAYTMTETGPKHGTVGRKSMRKVGNGLRATFVFRSLPTAGSRVMVVWLANGRPLAQVPKGRATTVTSSVLGISHGVFEAQLRVRPPALGWKTVAKVRRRL